MFQLIQNKMEKKNAYASGLAVSPHLMVDETALAIFLFNLLCQHVAIFFLAL